MKILTVHNMYLQPGGEDMVFEAESCLLADHGHEVEKLVFRNNDSASSTAGRLSAIVGLLYNWKSAAIFEEKLKALRPDIVHVHNFFPLASPSIFYVAQKHQVPVVVTLHNYRLICPSAILFYRQTIYQRSLRSQFPFDAIIKGVYRDSRLLTAGVAFCFFVHNVLGTWRKRVSRFVVLSDFAREIFRNSRLRVDHSQMTVKPNFVPDCGYVTGDRDKSFLFVGRLCEEKGVSTLLRAAKHSGFKLVIAGDGQLRPLVLQYVRDCPNITYLGFLDNPAVLREMRTCAALIFPSLWFEGFPVTILEAFSTGTPVIASRIGSIEEIVDDEVTGLLFNTGDDIDLAQKVARLHADATLVKRIGACGRATYEKRYTPEANYRMLMEVYKDAVEASRRTDKVGNAAAEICAPTALLTTDESSLPKLTIGIPTYNGAARIVRALNSAFHQRYGNLEIIISDNASTDKTQIICSQIARDHPEVTYYRQPTNLGLVGNFDFVLSNARGKYFMWLSDDDRLEPGILHKCVSFLELNDDFALASGQIVYWKGDAVDYIEKGFNFSNRFSAVRTIQYYSKAIYGGMFHGVMRRELAARIPARKVFGNDFHFVANVAYLGKIRNFDFPGYNKQLGGFSKDIHQCARALGESEMASRFPHIKIAIDAFAEVMYRSPVFTMPFALRFSTAILCFSAAMTNYYGRIVPLTIAGRIKRIVFRLFHIRDSGSLFKQASLAQRRMRVIK